MSRRTWDIGDPEPSEEVIAVDSMCEIFDDDYGQPMAFGRTYRDEWKGYLNGKLYLDWNEVVRRFGPVQERPND